MVLIFLGGHVIPLKLTAVEVNEAWMTFLTQPSFKCGFPSNINIFTMLSFSIKNNLNYLIIRSNLLRQNLKQMCIASTWFQSFSALYSFRFAENSSMWTGLLVLGYVQLENESMTLITAAHGKGKKGKTVWQWPAPEWPQCNWLLQVWSYAHGWLLPKGSFLPLLLTQAFPRPAQLSKPW